MEPLLADLGDPLQPLADCALGDSQRFGHFFVGPTLAFEFECAPTVLLLPMGAFAISYSAFQLSEEV